MNKDEYTLPGAEGKPILLDISYIPGTKRPVIIYAHGFNGFKDWGNFDLIAAQFVKSGFTFVKFNFSHNGTTPGYPQDFADLEAFGQNNYSKQLFDLDKVLDWIEEPGNPKADVVDAARIGLIGHSMGGGMAVIKTAQDSRVGALVTWAAIAECKTPWGNWPQERIDHWKQTGVDYYVNGRTKQQMPLYFQLYEDFQQHASRLDILKAASRITTPWQICHGTEDISVPVDKAFALHRAQPKAELVTVPSDHVFGRRHPWTEDILPEPMQQVLDQNIRFFRQYLNSNP